MRLDFGQFVYGLCREAKLSYGSVQLLLEIGRVAIGLDDERARIELLIGNLESVLSRAHLHVLQSEPQRRQRVVSIVIDHIGDRRSRADNLAAHFRVARKQSHWRVENALLSK